ncbi:hypothetical protein E2C01_078963 [Portunus trituberculatus]|uniref:Uncharacterized protein n=1 Tax=Portunus trituberculatus TaxID=210409 RepID=A0A5B7IVJ6_PORTR|nr:hypothetical protein [Portunus trituberculatus]
MASCVNPEVMGRCVFRREERAKASWSIGGLECTRHSDCRAQFNPVPLYALGNQFLSIVVALKTRSCY